MLLHKIQLINFRNYQDKTFAFAPDVTVVIGPNTSGKTNLLEAVCYLASGRSFKAEQEKEIIHENEELARVKGILKDEKEQPQALEIAVTNGIVMGRKVPRKKLLVNGVSKRMVDFADNFSVVLFWPEHLELITDSPSLRRAYLDDVLSSVSRDYRRAVFSYDKALRIRNKILKDKREILSDPSRSLNRIYSLDEQLGYWGEKLIESGNVITREREEYISFINNFKFSREAGSCSARQISNFKRNTKSQITYLAFYDKSEISEKRLAQYKQEEVWAGSTLVGPHRDDFVVSKSSNVKAQMSKPSQIWSKQIQNQKPKNLEDKELSKYGSRGEQRLGVLWLKLAELAFVEEKLGVKPLLLLDDIFSEFDKKHRELVLNIIPRQQTVIATTELPKTQSALFKKAQVIKLEL